ncbi:MAG: hypothetical protein Q9216_003381 [Gyalolechia sp. 2 TL-2023]
MRKHRELIHAVSTIYEDNHANISEWLFGGFSPKYENGEEKLEYWMDLREVTYKLKALYLSSDTDVNDRDHGNHTGQPPTFNRYISSNFIAETLGNHVKGLRKVVLGPTVSTTTIANSHLRNGPPIVVRGKLSLLSRR